MTTLKAEKRDMNVKAKKLRREGFVTGVLFGHDRKDRCRWSLPKKTLPRLIKESREGAQVILELGTEKISAIVKNIDYDPLQKQILGPGLPGAGGRRKDFHHCSDPAPQ